MRNSTQNRFVRFKEYLSPSRYGLDVMRERFDEGKFREYLYVVQRLWYQGCKAIQSSFKQRPKQTISSSDIYQELEQDAAELLSSQSKKPIIKVIDPSGNFIVNWNKGMLILCVFALALDPLFFYIPVLKLSQYCLELDLKMQTAACILRTIVDMVYISHIVLKFQTGFIPRSSQVFGKGDLVVDRSSIAKRYLSTSFSIDILAILPLPQVMLLGVIPLLNHSTGYMTKESLKFIIFSQLIPRIGRIYPIYKQVKSTSGVLTQTAWAGAAFNLFLYMLASHAAGAFWYMISVERQHVCWKEACARIKGDCVSKYLFCDEAHSVSPSPSPTPVQLFITSLNGSCPLINTDDITDPATFDFGIFMDALRSRVVESKRFRRKLFYCFWWGLRTLSSVGQNLQTSMFVGEVTFAVGLSIFGLVLFALLIGNMQTYLQSLSVRVEEMRVKRRDAELWMSHRLLPDDMRRRVRQYQQDKWQQNRGVEEAGLITNLPKDLRRDIKRHLCLNSLKKVPMFKKMDEQLIDAMCDRLKPVLYTEKSIIVREGDPIDEILFIIRGQCMTKTTTYGGRKGVPNKDLMKEGDLCGEELLPWALDPNSSPHHLPTSARTLYTVTQLEAFGLEAEDFKFVASQFSRRLHSKQLQHTFRYHSQQWKIWGACCIQVAWRNYIKRKKEIALYEAEGTFKYNVIDYNPDDDDEEGRGANSEASGFSSSPPAPPGLGSSVNALRFAPQLRRTLKSNLSSGSSTGRSRPPQKPDEPNFAIK